MICPICLSENNSKLNTYHIKCIKNLFDHTSEIPTLSFSRKDFFKEKSLLNSGRMSISGIQPKLSATLTKNNEIEIVPQNGAYIIKPSPEEFPFAAENEHLSMQLARRKKISTALCCLLHFSDGEAVYLTKRYDRLPHARLHQEDMAMAMGVSTANNLNYKYESYSYEAVGLFLKTHFPLVVVRDFFHLLVFNHYINNGDFHLKNISVLETDIKSGNYLLSPAYDLLNTRLHIPNEPELAMDLLTDDFSESHKKLGHYTRYDFEIVGERIGLAGKVRQNIYDFVYQDEIGDYEMIKNSYLPEELKQSYRACLAETRKKFFQ